MYTDRSSREIEEVFRGWLKRRGAALLKTTTLNSNISCRLLTHLRMAWREKNLPYVKNELVSRPMCHLPKEVVGIMKLVMQILVVLMRDILWLMVTAILPQKKCLNDYH